jgi:single-strand DNA-binding protein
MINKVTLLGRLGKDPELRYTTTQIPVCNFPLATSEHWKDAKGEKHEKTEWHRVTIWGKLGETANMFLKKGHVVFLEGKIQTRTWEDKTGAKRWATEILATTMQLLPKGQVGENRPPEPPPQDEPPHGAKIQDNSSWGGTNFNEKPQEPPMDFDEIPF